MYHRLPHNTAPLDLLGLLEGGGGREGREILTKRSSFHLNHHSRTLPFSSKSLEKGHAEKMLSKKPWNRAKRLKHPANNGAQSKTCRLRVISPLPEGIEWDRFAAAMNLHHPPVKKQRSR